MATASSRGCPEFLRLIVVEPSPFLDLPVHAGGLLVKDLHPVHPHVPLPVTRIVGHDLRERDEPSAVLRPAGEHRERVEVRSFDDLLRDGRGDIPRRRVRETVFASRRCFQNVEGCGGRDLPKNRISSSPKFSGMLPQRQLAPAVARRAR